MTIADDASTGRRARYGEDEDAALTVRRREFQHHINMFGVAFSAGMYAYYRPLQGNLTVCSLSLQHVSRQSAANPGHMT